MVSTFTRAGLAHQAGAPIGASWNIAQSTTSLPQARVAGQAFGLASGNSGTTVQDIVARQRAAAAQPTTGSMATGIAAAADTAPGRAAFSALHALNTPLRVLGDVVEANVRYARNNIASGDGPGDWLKGSVAMMGGISAILALDPEYRAGFGAAQEAQSSPMQTAWLAGKSVVAPDAIAPNADPFRLLDDADLSEREEYFGSGTAKWVTGVGDLAINIFADPLVIGGKAAGGVRAGLKMFTAGDVAAAASGSANLTRAGRRVETMVNRVAQAFDDASATPGAMASLSRMKFISQTTDAGAIPAIMRELDGIADPVARMAARKNALYAGMGHRPSLQALRAQGDTQLMTALQIQSYIGPNRNAAINTILTNAERTHLQNLQGAHRDQWLDDVIAAHRDEIVSKYDQIERVIKIGNPTGADLATTTGLGELNSLPTFIRVGHTFQKSLGLPPIHALFGKNLPHMINLDGDDAYDLFASAVMRTAGRLERKSQVSDVYRKMLDDFALTRGATDPAAARAQRRIIVDAFKKAETDRLVVKYATGDPAHAKKIRDFIKQVQSNRTDEMVHFRSRVQQAVDSESPLVHVIDDADGVYTMKTTDAQAMVSTPFAGTQSDHLSALLDYRAVEHAIKTRFTEGVEGFMRKTADGTWKLTEEGLTVMSDLWKFLALARPGYPIRNFTDTQLRNAAMMDATDIITNTIVGLRNMRYNRGKVRAADVERQVIAARAQARIDEIDDFLRVGANNQAHANRATALRLERARMEQVRDAARNAMGTRPQSFFQLEARLNRAKTDLKALGPRKSWTPSQKMRANTLKRQIREMQKGLNSEYVRTGETSLARHIGMEDQLPDWAKALGLTDRNPVFRNVEDAERAIDIVDAKDMMVGLAYTSGQSNLAKVRLSDHFQLIGPNNSGYYKSYVEMINKRIRQDRGLMEYAAGGSRDTLRRWYTVEPEGVAIWKGFESRYPGGVEDFISKQMEQVDLLLEDGAFRSLVMQGPITEAMAREALDAAAKKPLVPQHMLEVESENPLRRLVGRYERTKAWWFKYAGELPEEMLGRLPFFVSRKRMHMDKLWPVDNATGQAVKLTREQMNELHLQADVLARRDVGRYLFDTSQQSNLAAHLRFFSPFYNAWSDTMRKWARIAGYNPAVVPLGAKLFMAPNAMWTVVDENGNQILVNGDIVNSEGEVIGSQGDPTQGTIVIPIPKWLGGERMSEWLGGTNELRISKSSLNVTFQGEPFWLPSMGPLATIPANIASNEMFPDLADSKVGKYLLPFGPDEDPMAQAIPMWMKNLQTAYQQNPQDARFANTYATILATKMGEIERGEAEPMTEKELREYTANAARNWWIMRFFSNYFGYSAIPTSRMDFYVNEFRRLKSEYGYREGTDRFMEQYPDYAEATISLSFNETGIVATDETWDNSKRYESEITANPQYGWMYVGAANMAPGEQSAGVYTAQRERGWRTTKTPQQAYADTRIQSGWRDYTRVQNAINEELARREAAGGKKSITANANRDLWEYRLRFVTELKADNPEWAGVYEQGGTAESIDSFFRAAANAAESNPELAGRSDFRALDSYLQVRDAVREELARRGLSSIDSRGAEDLKEYWGNFTAELVASDIGFEQMYNRGGLERDTLPVGALALRE